MEPPTGFFKPTRGLRQGDPLSPYLFIICMEGLSRFLLEAEEKKLITGIKMGKDSPSISHLLFADDCLIFTRVGKKECKNLVKILDLFSQGSGQLINYDKSGIFFSNSVSNSEAREILQILKVGRVRVDDKYLGVPLFTHKSKIKCFESIINNLRPD